MVLIGKHAARGWSRLGIDLPTVECPHPSPQNLNSRPQLRPQILEALREAKAIASTASTAARSEGALLAELETWAVSRALPEVEDKWDEGYEQMRGKLLDWIRERDL